MLFRLVIVKHCRLSRSVGGAVENCFDKLIDWLISIFLWEWAGCGIIPVIHHHHHHNVELLLILQVEMCENFGIEIDASSAGALQVTYLLYVTFVI